MRRWRASSCGDTHPFGQFVAARVHHGAARPFSSRAVLTRPDGVFLVPAVAVLAWAINPLALSFRQVEIAVKDVQMACNVHRATWDATHHQDGFVSLEVAADLAHDEHRSIEAARTFWQRVKRPNVMIKIPGTPEGVGAIEQATYEGININVTLLFSVEAYEKVHDAYLKGLERRQAEGKSLDVASVASFFVSRVDTEIDKRLEKIGTDEALALRGQSGVANSRLAYAAFQEVFSGERWNALVAKGAKTQRPLWASTGVKNPEYSDTLYVSDLVVADTVNTMPEKTMMAYADHGEHHGDAVTGTAAQAQSVFDAVAAQGIDLTDVFLVLEDEGVDKFEKSWAELLDTVKSQLDGAKA